MVKQKGGGLPYLKTSLKFDFDSFAALDDTRITDFYETLKGLIKEYAECVEIASTEPAKHGSQLDGENLSIGLQPVFTLIGNEKARYVLLDSDLVKPSGVANIIALYIQNSPGTTAFAINGLAKHLAVLKIKADAIATTENASSINDFLNSTPLRPVSKLNRQGSRPLTPAVVTKSQGKKQIR